MPEFSTQHFGTLTYAEDSVIRFPGGLPGFEREKLFLPIQQPASKPFVFLQSLATPSLCFITLPTGTLDPHYRLRIEADDLRLLGLPFDREPVAGTDVISLAIVSVDEKEPPTANLLAPIVIALNSRLAAQAIQADAAYSHRHPIPLQPGA